MQFENAFNEWKPTLSEIANSEIKSPSIPVHKFCAEAEALSVSCHKDKEQLLSTGLNWQHVDDLLSLSCALRYCQAIWKSTPDKSEAQIQWLNIKKEAIALKKELLRHFTYAFYQHHSIKKKLTTIKKHRDNNSLAPNLLALVNIAKNNPTLLERINYDIDQTEQAHYLSHKVSEYLALVNVSNNSKYESKLWRDRAYTLLYKRMNDIRACGQYVFHNNKKKYKQYVSEYYRKHNASNRKPKSV